MVSYINVKSIKISEKSEKIKMKKKIITKFYPIKRIIHNIYFIHKVHKNLSIIANEIFNKKYAVCTYANP